jgi:putative intracellular protease/amidase
MKRLGIAVLGIVILAGTMGLAPPGVPYAGATGSRTEGEVNVLLLVCHQYGANTNLLRDQMELLGWNVTVIGLSPVVSVCYWGGPMTVDKLISEITDITRYDILAIMPARATTGTSHSQLLNSPEALQFVAQAVDAGLLVCAFCGGTRVLAAADVLQGIHVTGHPDYLQEYLDAGAIWMGQPVPPVLDGNILTSVRGQYYCHQVVDVMASAVDSIRTARSGTLAGARSLPAAQGGRP